MTELRAPGLVLELGTDGTLVAATSTARPEVRWLSGVGPLEVTTPAGPLGLGAPVVAVDVDEVEVERTGSGLRTVVRHGVDGAWDVRVVLANESDASLDLTQVRLGWRADPGCVVSALAAGATAAYAVQPYDGDGPVLVGRLRSGAQAGVDEAGFVLGPLTLAAGHRWSASWRFEIFPDPRRAAPFADGPPTTWLDLDQTVLLPAGPDVAVVAPTLTTEVVDDRVEVGADEPGTHDVELRAARGTTAYALTWAPDLDDLVDGHARRLLNGPRTASGTVRLPDVRAGLVIQDAYARRTADRSDDLADTLDVLAGTLLDRLDDQGESAPGADPWAVAFLSREAVRTGDPAFADVASRMLLEVRTPRPGTGLAGVALALSLVGSGRPAGAVMAHLATLRRPPYDAGAALELALLLRAGHAPADEPLLAGLRRLGAALGAGLPGRLRPAPAVDRVAYASTLLGLVDEPTGQRLRATWGVSAAELARQAAAQSRARALDAERDPAAHTALAWLVVGRPPR